MAIKCPCGETVYDETGYGIGWNIPVPYAEGPVWANYCPNCGRELNEEGTFGKEYSDLKAENQKLQEEIKELKKKY